VLIPLGVLLTEPNHRRRLFITIPLFLGAAIAVYSMRSLWRDGVTAHIEQHCILYETPAYAGIYVIVAYLVATCAAFFFSTQRSMVRIGWINAAAFSCAFIFYRVFLTSAWCFFAAILSGLIYLHYNHLPSDRRRDKL
jgi:hypothetical protein